MAAVVAALAAAVVAAVVAVAAAAVVLMVVARRGKCTQNERNGETVNKTHTSPQQPLVAHFRQPRPLLPPSAPQANSNQLSISTATRPPPPPPPPPAPAQALNPPSFFIISLSVFQSAVGSSKAKPSGRRKLSSSLLVTASILPTGPAAPSPSHSSPAAVSRVCVSFQVGVGLWSALLSLPRPRPLPLLPHSQLTTSIFLGNPVTL